MRRPKPRWVVIHNNLFGYRGGIVGYAHVDAGEHTNIRVPIAVSSSTDHLYAEMHWDRGSPGVVEYPPPIDESATVNGRAVWDTFTCTAGENNLIYLDQVARNALQQQNPYQYGQVGYYAATYTATPTPYQTTYQTPYPTTVYATSYPTTYATPYPTTVYAAPYRTTARTRTEEAGIRRGCAHDREYRCTIRS